MALPATDVFTGTGALSGSWTARNGSIVRNSDHAVGNSASTSNAVYWNADAFANDQYSQVVLGTVGGAYFGPSVRYSSSAYTGYEIEVSNGGAINLYKTTAGVGVQVATYTGTVSAGQTIRAEVVGNVITVKQNGTTRITYTDSVAPITSGSAGLWIYGNDTTRYLDNWEGGNMVTTTPASGYLGDLKLGHGVLGSRGLS